MRNAGGLIPPVSAEELKFAVALAYAAAAMKGPYPTPTDKQFTIADDITGDEMTYRFADSAVARAGLAVVEHFGQEAGKGVALLMRWSELSRLMKDERMQAYMRKAGDRSGAVGLRPEVLEVAAELSFDAQMGFNAQTFFRTLNARVGRHRRRSVRSGSSRRPRKPG
jgi:hypothetical protein